MQAKQASQTLGEQAGLLWTWWKGDSLPGLSPLLDFTVEEAKNVEVLAQLMEVSSADVMELLQEGHRPYLAYLGLVPVAVGWSASGRASFGGGLVTFQLPAKNRYLYYFVTFPAWRGRGIYPRLLQYIVNNECDENERFWIVHQLSNVASERGIRKAGFRIASSVYFLSAGKLGLLPPVEAGTRAIEGAALLGLPLIEDTGDA